MTPLDAPIGAVTVYTDRARVTRRGTVHLPPGEQTVELGSLPTTLEANSVRASGRGANARIIGVEVATQFVAVAPESSLADLESQITALKDNVRVLADEDRVEKARLSFLQQLQANGSAAFANALAKGQTSVESLEALTQYLASEQAAGQARRREIARKRRDLPAVIAALQAQQEAAQAGETYERRAIRVTIEATAETDLELEILYAVTGAAWQPLYDVRLDDTRIALTYLAAITQQTGESWPAVELTLSTARPAVSATLPQLHPLYLDPYTPRPGSYAMGGVALPASIAAQPARGRPNDAPGQDAYTASKQAEPLPTEEAEIESSGAAVTYRVARPVAVPADGAPHRTTVTTLDFPARLDYLTAPRLAEEAYLRAKVTNNSAFALLPGPANIFHGPDFVGTTALPAVAPNEEFALQLGVDSRIKVERALIERATSRAAVIGNTRRVLFAYKLTLTNHLTTPAHLTVQDQVPVARHEEIKVRLQEISLKPTEQTDLGLLTWEIDLPPGDKREITFTYTVEYPRTMTVSGLPQ